MSGWACPRRGSASCRAGPAPSAWSAALAPSAVKRLVLTGEPVDAAEALRLGLVDFLCPKGQGLTRAREIAATIAERGPVAVQIAKQLVNVAEGEEGPAAVEALAGALAAMTEDAKEGVGAFRDKRQAKFRGR